MDRAVEAPLQDGTVNLAKLLRRSFLLHPHDDAVRMEEVSHGRAFAQEFGVGGDVEF